MLATKSAKILKIILYESRNENLVGQTIHVISIVRTLPQPEAHSKQRTRSSIQTSEIAPSKVRLLVYTFHTADRRNCTS